MHTSCSIFHYFPFLRPCAAQALAQVALQTHQKAVATFHAERVERMKAELAASAAAEAAEAAASNAATTTQEAGNDDENEADSGGGSVTGGEGRGSQGRNTSNHNTNSAANATVEEKLATGARQLASSVLGHRNACFTCSFTDPSTAVAALHHSRHSADSTATGAASKIPKGSASKSSGSGIGRKGFYAMLQQRQRQQLALALTPVAEANKGSVPPDEAPPTEAFDSRDGNVEDAAAAAEVDGWLRLFGYRGPTGSDEATFWHQKYSNTLRTRSGEGMNSSGNKAGKCDEENGSSSNSSNSHKSRHPQKKKKKKKLNNHSVVTRTSFLAHALVVRCGIRCLKSLIEDLTEEGATIAASAAVAASSLSQAQAFSGSDCPANAAMDADVLVAKDVSFLMTLRTRSTLAPVDSGATGRGKKGHESGSSDGDSACDVNDAGEAANRRLYGIGPEHLKVAVLWSAPAHATTASSSREKQNSRRRPESATNNSSSLDQHSVDENAGTNGDEDEEDDTMYPLGAPPLDEECMASWLEADASKKRQPMLYFRVFEPVLMIDGVEDEEDDDDERNRSRAKGERSSIVVEEKEDMEKVDEETEKHLKGEFNKADAASRETGAGSSIPDTSAWQWGVRAWGSPMHSGANNSNGTSGDDDGDDDDDDAHRRRKYNRRRRSGTSVVLSDNAPRSMPFHGPLDALRFDGGGCLRVDAPSRTSRKQEVAATEASPLSDSQKRRPQGKHSSSYVGAVPYLSPARVRLMLETRLASYSGSPQCLQREAVSSKAPC